MGLLQLMDECPQYGVFTVGMEFPHGCVPYKVLTWDVCKNVQIISVDLLFARSIQEGFHGLLRHPGHDGQHYDLRTWELGGASALNRGTCIGDSVDDFPRNNGLNLVEKPKALAAGALTARALLAKGSDFALAGGFLVVIIVEENPLSPVEVGSLPYYLQGFIHPAGNC